MLHFVADNVIMGWWVEYNKLLSGGQMLLVYISILTAISSGYHINVVNHVE